MDGKPGKPELVTLSSPRIFLFFRSSNSAICFIKQSESPFNRCSFSCCIAVRRTSCYYPCQNKIFHHHSYNGQERDKTSKPLHRSVLSFSHEYPKNRAFHWQFHRL